jgi:hypothetical protein
LKIEVPRKYSGQTEVHNLLQMTAKLVSESLDAAMKKREVDLSKKDHRQGLAAAAIICNSHPCSLIDDNTVKYQPSIPELVIKVLEKAGRSVQSEDPLLDLPCFRDAAKYVRSLRGTGRRRVLGKMNGADVFVSVIETVETYDRNKDDFFGKCIVRIGDHEIQGYCLGSIAAWGTGMIICQDENLIAYSPPNVIDK